MLRLEELRKKLNLSQNELAEKLNMTQQRISAYEKGKRAPDIDTLKQLADFFGVSIDFLLGKSDIRNYDKDEKDFRFAYHSETEGLTDEEIADALRFYKEMKKKIDKKNNK